MGFRPSAKMVRLTPLRLLSAVAVVFVIYLASSTSLVPYRERGYEILPAHASTVHAHDASTPAVRFGDECSPFAAGALRDVTFVLRLSAAASPDTLPAYLHRLGRCKQDLLVFSARKHSFGGFDVLDALAHLRPEYRWANPDFDMYDRLHAANASDAPPRDAWRLDKYTTLPMMEWTSYLRPDAKWFVFLEPDTYLNYDNLYRFLSAFTPATAHYFGSPVAPHKAPAYAHPGAAAILSRAALNKLMARGRMFAENHHFPGTHFFGEPVTDASSGDAVLASVLKKSGVPLRGYAPMFNPEAPTTLGFGPETWCEALVTLHGLDDKAFASLAQWEASRKHPERPLIFEELFTLVESRLKPRADDWTNLSADKIHKAGSTPAKSPAACEKACSKDINCLQWEHSVTTCALGHSIRIGKQRQRDTERRWTSGWMLDRIAAFKTASSPCQGARFVHADP